MLLTVSGVGPKAALSILSDTDPQKFALTVASGESKPLTKTKGVGPKLAQRIVLELKDKIAKENISGEVYQATSDIQLAGSDGVSEAVSALMVLGYSQSEAASAVSKVSPELSSSEIIKQALKIIGSSMK